MRRRGSRAGWHGMARAVVVAIAAMAVVGLMGVLTSGLVGAPALSATDAASPGATVAPGETLSAAAGPLAIHDPSPNTGSTGPSALASAIPSPMNEAPWVQALEHPDSSLKPLASLPNLGLLQHPATTRDGSVQLTYDAQPAPLGLADYGLGAHTYAYNATDFLGQVTFYSPPNATDPGSTSVIVPNATALGDVGNEYEFGIQLNTVATNVTFPDSDQGFFWTQNVVNWNDTTIHFVSDTFNLTYNVTPGAVNLPGAVPDYIPPGTIVSGCNNGTAGVDEILAVYGGVFQCVGPNIPVSPAAYPVTIQLYNNLSVNAQNEDVLTYGYSINESGIDQVYSGVSDVIVFNNPGAPAVAPATTPGFSVDGFAPSPGGLLRDAELDLVGDIEGDNAVFRSLDGTVNLEYANSPGGPFVSVPSAYNFGGDTGETSTGIADYWEPNETLVVHQGPSMLYGLWHAIPSASVASGDIQISGSITPAYGFVFVSNTPPVTDPFAARAAADNMSWLPTTDNGSFDTFLPPLGAPWTSHYYVQAFAAGSKEANGTEISGSTQDYRLTLAPDPGNLNAPLYMFGNAQAAELAYNLTQQLAPPYLFNDLTVNINASFDHLNDYAYPSFELVMAQSVTVPIYVNDTVQGSDSPLGNFYFADGAPYPPGETSTLYPAPAITPSLPDYTSQINLFGGVDDVVTNQTLYGVNVIGPGVFTQGGEVVLWEDQGATVVSTLSETGSNGVWIGASNGTEVEDLVAEDAYGISDINSNGTTGDDITVVAGLGVEAYSSTNDSFVGLNVLDGSVGVETGFDIGLGSAFGYYDVPGTVHLTVEDLVATGGSLGANITFSNDTVIDGVTAAGAYAAVTLDGTFGADLTGVTANDSVYDVLVYDATYTNITAFTAFNDSLALPILGYTNWTVVTFGVFVGSTGPAVLILGGTSNYVYDNDFLGNDGSTLVYDPATIQAYSVAGNYFNSSDGPGVGNYWADWHLLPSPYVISNGVEDYFPLAIGPGMYNVTFSESGLPAKGKTWSVTFLGLTENSTLGSRRATGSALTFLVPVGDWPYLGIGPAGYRVELVRDGSGPGPQGEISVTGTSGPTVEFVRGATYSLSFREVGLGSGTLWCVTIALRSVCGSSPTLSLKNLTPSTYAYSIQSFGGVTTLEKVGKTWSVQSSGEAVVATKSVAFQVRYAYPVQFNEIGLTGVTNWTVSAEGETVTSNASAIVLYLTNGTQAFSVKSVAGYTRSPASGRVTELGAPITVTVTFTPVPSHRHLPEALPPSAAGPPEAARVA